MRRQCAAVDATIWLVEHLSARWLCARRLLRACHPDPDRDHDPDPDHDRDHDRDHDPDPDRDKS